MDNNELITRIISFDDDGINTSTGFVGIEQEPDYEEYVRNAMSRSISVTHLTGRKKDDETMFVDDHIVTGWYSEITINCDKLAPCLTRYPDIKLITQAERSLVINGSYQNVKAVLSRIVRKYMDFGNMREYDTNAYGTAHINIIGTVPDNVELSCADEDVAIGKNILVNIEHAYTGKNRIDFDLRFDCNALDLQLGVCFDMGTHTYTYAGINLSEECHITNLTLDVKPLYSYANVNLDVELKSSNSTKSIFSLVLVPEKGVWLSSLKGLKHIWDKLVVTDRYRPCDEIMGPSGYMINHPSDAVTKVAKFLEEEFNKGHFDVTVQQ